MIKWLGQVFGKTSHEVTEQGALEEAKRRKQSDHFIDLPHHVLSEDAARHYAELDGLIKSGWPAVKRDKVKKRVRRKVWEVISRSFRPDDDMVEEITERIIDAAEVDPYYEAIFSRDESENEITR